MKNKIKKQKRLKNEFLILYFVADMFAYHFISNDLAKMDENNNLIFIKNPVEFKKAEKRTYKIMFQIIDLLNKSLSREGFLTIKRKYERILKGFAENKEFNDGYAPVLIGISILSAYAKEPFKKRLKIHPKSVEKLLELIKEEAKIKYLDEFVINSLVLGDKFYKVLKND